MFKSCLSRPGDPMRNTIDFVLFASEYLVTRNQSDLSLATLYCEI